MTTSDRLLALDAVDGRMRWLALVDLDSRPGRCRGRCAVRHRRADRRTHPGEPGGPASGRVLRNHKLTGLTSDDPLVVGDLVLVVLDTDTAVADR